MDFDPPITPEEVEREARLRLARESEEEFSKQGFSFVEDKKKKKSKEDSDYEDEEGEDNQGFEVVKSRKELIAEGKQKAREEERERLIQNRILELRKTVSKQQPILHVHQFGATQFAFGQNEEGQTDIGPLFKVSASFNNDSNRWQNLPEENDDQVQQKEPSELRSSHGIPVPVRPHDSNISYASAMQLVPHVFEIEYKTVPGEIVHVVGDHQAIGAWDIERAPALFTGADIFPKWKSREIGLSAQRVEYKFLLKNDKGELIKWITEGNNLAVEIQPISTEKEHETAPVSAEQEKEAEPNDREQKEKKEKEAREQKEKEEKEKEAREQKEKEKKEKEDREQKEKEEKEKKEKEAREQKEKEEKEKKEKEAREQKEKEEKEKEAREQKEKEAREQKEKEEKEKKEKEAREQKEKEAREQKEKEDRENKEKEDRENKEKEARENKEKEAREQKEKEEKEKEARGQKFKEALDKRREDKEKRSTPRGYNSLNRSTGGFYQGMLPIETINNTRVFKKSTANMFENPPTTKSAWVIAPHAAKVQPTEYGRHCADCCYLVFNPSKQRNCLHIWHGDKFTQDLDSALDQVEKLHGLLDSKIRTEVFLEPSRNESERFMALFDEGVLYLPENYKPDRKSPRLFRLHFNPVTKSLRVYPTECTPDSLDSGDVFVLDGGDSNIYRWIGSGANRVEIAKSLQFANNIKNNECKGSANLIELVQGKNPTDPNWEHFYKTLGGQPPSANQNRSDREDKPEAEPQAPKVYQIKDNFQSWEQVSISLKDMNSANSYLVDSDRLYVWFGKDAPSESLTALRLAIRFSNQVLKTVSQISQVFQESEPPQFLTLLKKF